MKNWWVYVLSCGDGSFYTGSTTDYHRRLAEHSSGKGAKYTRSHLPVRLHHVIGPLPNRSFALKLENLIKKKSHKWKEKVTILDYFHLLGKSYLIGIEFVKSDWEKMK